MKIYRLFSFLLLIGTELVLYAQPNFRPGYIVNSTGDTIKGLVDYRVDKKLFDHCTFRNENKESFTYRAEQIQAYGFENGRMFRSDYSPAILQF